MKPTCDSGPSRPYQRSVSQGFAISKLQARGRGLKLLAGLLAWVGICIAPPTSMIAQTITFRNVGTTGITYYYRIFCAPLPGTWYPILEGDYLCGQYWYSIDVDPGYSVTKDTSTCDGTYPLWGMQVMVGNNCGQILSLSDFTSSWNLYSVGNGTIGLGNPNVDDTSVGSDGHGRGSATGEGSSASASDGSSGPGDGWAMDSSGMYSSGPSSIGGDGPGGGPDPTVPQDSPDDSLDDLLGGNPQDDQNDCGNPAGMPVWRVIEPNISVELHDRPLSRYRAAIGPWVTLDLRYEQREANAGYQSHTFSLGKKWNFSWLSYVAHDPFGSNVVHLPGGTLRTYYGTNDYLSNTSLTGNTNSGFTLTYPDGSQDFYGLIVTNSFGKFLQAFLTEMRNPRSQKITLNYAPWSPAITPIIRLTSVVDANNGTNLITYVTSNAYSTNLISSVSNPWGGAASFLYDPSGRLTNICDVLGTNSAVAYDANDFATSMITPYGTTSFTIVESNPTNAPNGRSVLVTEADGSHQLFLCTNGAPGVAGSYSPGDVPVTTPFANTFDNSGLDQRNSFHWGRRQYAALSTTTISAFTANDFRKARMKHWLTSPATVVTEVLSLRRSPSPEADGSTEGQKTWFDYAGKAANNSVGSQVLPLFEARVLPNGTTRYSVAGRYANGLPAWTGETYTGAGGDSVRYTYYTYSGNGVDVVAVTNAAGVRAITNLFNSYHQVLNTWDALNQQTSILYNGNLEVLSISRPSGLTTTNIYFSSGQSSNRLSQTIDLEIGRTNSYTYYSSGLIQTHTDPRGLVTTWYWDGLSRLTGIVFPDTTSVSNVYNRLDLAAVKDRLGHWTYASYDSMRRRTQLTNAIGTVTGFSYCSCGALSQLTNAYATAVQQVSSFSYDNRGRMTNAVGADSYGVTNWFNAIGQVTKTGDGNGYRTYYYNNQGRISVVSNEFGLELAVVYDVLDRPLWTTNANQVVVTNSYDTLERLVVRTFPDGGAEQFGYSARGLISNTNQLGLTNFFTLDQAGRRLFETNANGELLQFQWSPAGDLTNLIDGKGQSTRFNPNEWGLVTNKLDQSGTEILRYAYDAGNRPLSRWSAAKGTTYYTNDAVGNLIFIKYPSSPSVSFGLDPLGRRTNMVDAVGTTLFTWNSANQLLTEDGPFAYDTLTNNYSNRRRVGVSLQQPTGVWTNAFALDDAGRITGVTSPAGTFTYSFDPLRLGLVNKLLLPNSAYVTNTYGPLARLLTNSLNNSSDTPLDRYAYGYNPANQRTNLIRTDNSTVAFGYDNIGQLTVADSSANSEDRGYFYDTAWNLNRRTNNGVMSTFQVDNKNELTNAPSPVVGQTYDANGNTVTSHSGKVALVYDDENQLIQWFNYHSGPTCLQNNDLRTDLVYDGLLRLRKRLEYTYSTNSPPPPGGGGGGQAPPPAGGGSCNGGTWNLMSETDYIYDGRRVIQERDGNHTPLVSYTRGSDLSGTLEGAGGIGGLLARSSGYSSGNWTTHNYYHADGNGNITYMLDASQAMAASYRFDSFGNLISKSGSLADANVYRFSSKEIHVSSGMYYFLYRFYDPNLQRWINRDPIQENGGVNLYGYLGSSPVTSFDPFGLDPGYWTLVGNGLNNTVTAVGQSIGVASYVAFNATRQSLGFGSDPGFSRQTVTAQYVQAGELMWSVNTPANPAATPYVAGFLGVSAVAASAAGAAWAGEAAGLTTMNVAVGAGDSPFFVHVAYGVGETWVNAIGTISITSPGLIATEALAAETAEEAWITITGIPVINGEAVVATGQAAWTCVTAAVSAFFRGWTLP